MRIACGAADAFCRVLHEGTLVNGAVERLARNQHLSPSMSKRDEYQKNMEEKLALWNARLETLTAKATAAVKTHFHKELEEWKAAGENATGKLTQLRDTTGDAWDTIKLEMEKIWHAIESALSQAEEKRRTAEDNATATAAAPAPESASASTPAATSTTTPSEPARPPA